MPRSSTHRVIASALVVLGLLLAAPAADAHRGSGHHRLDLSKIHPIVFVHGAEGSGAQFESQKMRFASNGYPLRLVYAFEYDSLSYLGSVAAVQAALDRFIADVKQKTGASQVDLLGHSLGTAVSQTYLNSSAAHAANVAHYVNIDGGQAASPPGGVPTLALWAGRGTPGRTIGGATNVTIPNQTHVQSATSAESFAEMFKFFTGHPPKTTNIVRQHGWITVAGRAVLFPQNVGLPAGSTLAIWRVRSASGQRIGKHPAATPTLASDGSWGPIWVKTGQHYEFAINQSGQVHHLYYEPFRRSDHLVRLLTQVPGTFLDALTSKSASHVNLVFTRNKEFWGDQGAESDSVEVNGANVINAADSPINHRTIGMFAFDQGSDGVSNISAPIPVFFGIPFLSAVDLLIPAASPSTGKVSVALRSRGAGPVRTVNFPNRPSTTDTTSVQFDDFEH
jgi:pimeloyl-ACP methyl ester carboxylesterase